MSHHYYLGIIGNRLRLFTKSVDRFAHTHSDVLNLGSNLIKFAVLVRRDIRGHISRVFDQEISYGKCLRHQEDPQHEQSQSFPPRWPEISGMNQSSDTRQKRSQQLAAGPKESLAPQRWHRL